MLSPETAELWRLIRGYIGDIDVIERLLAGGADATTPDDRGRTILHCALEHTQALECIQLLILAGADPTVVDPEYGTLVQNAMSQYGYQEGSKIIKFLVDHGVPASSKTTKGHTWLHIASAITEDDNWARGDANGFSVVLENELKDLPIDVLDNDGATPLHYAASISEFNVARLLQAGADPTVLTLRGASALHIASLGRQPNIVGLLLKEYERRGVLDKFVNMPDGELGRTPLHYACRSGRPESVRYLISHRSNVYAKDPNSREPIHALAEFSIEEQLWDSPMTGAHRLRTHLTSLSDSFRPAGIRPPIGYRDPERVVEILALLEEADVNLNEDVEINGIRTSPIGLALENKGAEMVRELMRRGVKCQELTTQFESNTDKEAMKLLNMDSEDTVRGIFNLLCDANYDALEEFVRRGGDLTATDGFRNNTSLHTLVEGGYDFLLEIFKYKASQADDMVWMKEEDNPGTLLGRACFRKLPNLHVLKILIEKIGLDINAASNPRGYIYKLGHATALHRVACGRNFWNIEAVEYLIQQGADVEAHNGWGQTPLLAALSSAYPNGFWKEETVRVLLKHGADSNAQSTNWEKATCLQLADSAAITRLLLQYGADIKKSTSALTLSIERMDLEMAQVLLDAGQDPNFCARLRYPLHEASRRSVEDESPYRLTQQIEMIRILLQRGADPFATYPNGVYVLQAIVEKHGIVDPFFAIAELDIERIGIKGRTLLISACIPTRPPHEHVWNSPAPPAISRPDMILKLIDRGANVHALDISGRTPLHWLCTVMEAFDDAHKRAFNAIVQGSPINLRDYQGFKPIHLALASHQTWAVDQLLHLGSGIESDPNDNTALHHYAPRLGGSTGLTEFERFLTLGVDIDARNKAGETPLFVFMATGGIAHLDKISLFLHKGADIFTTNNKGETILHAIVRRKIKYPWINSEDVEEAKECFQHFVNLGLNARQKDVKKRTAIDIAGTRGLRAITSLFQGQGRIVEISDDGSDGESVSGECCDGEKTYSDDGYCSSEN